jgi:hypothetical protein
MTADFDLLMIRWSSRASMPPFIRKPYRLKNQCLHTFKHDLRARWARWAVLLRLPTRVRCGRPACACSDRWPVLHGIALCWPLHGHTPRWPLYGLAPHGVPLLAGRRHAGHHRALRKKISSQIAGRFLHYKQIRDVHGHASPLNNKWETCHLN